MSAWEVAVAAPSPVLADEPRSTVAMPVTSPIPQAEPAAAVGPESMGASIANGFGRALQAATRYGAASQMDKTPEQAVDDESQVDSKDIRHEDLVAEVLALHDAQPLTPKDEQPKPAYSRRTVVA